VGTSALNGDLECCEHPRREALLFAQQAEQDVLGADVVVAQRPRLFLGQDDDVAGALCKSLEQTPEDRSSPGRLQASAKTVVQALGGNVTRPGTAARCTRRVP